MDKITASEWAWAILIAVTLLIVRLMFVPAPYIGLYWIVVLVLAGIVLGTIIQRRRP